MRKGFTLVELLAVILILGIITLIAIPTVKIILNEARKGAFKTTLMNIEKAVESNCSIQQIMNKELDTVYTITDGKIMPKVEIKGDLPDGTIYLNNECSVYFTLFDSNFTGIKNENEDIEIVEKKVYIEKHLNGANPVLGNNLIPVVIADDGTVTKADIFSKWYSYEEKKWANAVILTDTGKVEDDGTIKEDSIESYFVWIPRFKYKLFDLGNYTGYVSTEKPTVSNAKEIEIVFENVNNEISNGDEVNEYLSHPAFTSFNSNGFWAGKYEVTGTVNNITVKPNKVALGNQTLGTMFHKFYEYKRENNSHMMKNTEWGAITYLSHSKYGRCTDNVCVELNLNNHSGFLTGHSHVVGTDQSTYRGTFGTTSNVTLPYNTETGYLASTTGNITGIYDMSGGAHEYVAGYVDGYFGNSGITQKTVNEYGSKYFDIYSKQSSVSGYSNRILGDATGELGPFYYYKDGDNNTRYHNGWYGDSSYFVEPGESWFCRGGSYNYGGIAGTGYFARYTGAGRNYMGFRLVLGQ